MYIFSSISINSDKTVRAERFNNFHYMLSPLAFIWTQWSGLTFATCWCWNLHQRRRSSFAVQMKLRYSATCNVKSGDTNEENELGKQNNTSQKEAIKAMKLMVKTNVMEKVTIFSKEDLFSDNHFLCTYFLRFILVVTSCLL
jgi:hypothetical protein